MKTNPQNLKFKKFHRPFLSSKISKAKFKLRFGPYGLQSCSSAKLTFSQIEASRKAIRRTFRKLGRLWIRVFPFWSITRKPLAVRMGKGKGSPSFWVSPVAAGQNILEISGISDVIMHLGVRAAAKKLPVRVKFNKNLY